MIQKKNFLIEPDGYDIPYDVDQTNGISTQLAEEKGEDLETVLRLFNEVLAKSTFVVGQNVKFDLNIMGCEFHRKELATNLNDLPVLDTCSETTANLCQLKGGRGGKFKYPTLTELHQYLFGSSFGDAHNATADVEATTRCFLELIRKRVFTKEELKVSSDYFETFENKNPTTINVIGLKHIDLKKESKKLKTKSEENSEEIKPTKGESKVLDNANFSHLHCHSQFSILQSTSSVSNLLQTAIKDKMPAVALTDTGNMMGAFYFIKEALEYNKSAENFNANLAEGQEAKLPIKPILGCEFYVCENHTDKSQKDNGYHIVILAKNKTGYHNLAKMSSISNTDGFYDIPRIDKDIIEQYKEGLMVLSGNLFGEIPSKILNVGEKQAEEALLWWKEQFGEDFYLEVMRHDQENENHVNEVLVEFSKKHQEKLIATNNTYYTKQE